MGRPTFYPTGTTLYNKDRAYSGYTILPTARGALLIDMNGRGVRLWKGLKGFPNKILPGGYVLGSSGERDPKYAYQDQLDLLQVDWDGNIVWKYERNEAINDPGSTRTYAARQHHDFQREGSPVGYYAPEQEPLADKGKTLLLVHENLRNTRISDIELLDDRIIEIDWEGKLLWSWNASDHFDELGFDETAKNAIYRNPSVRPLAGGPVGDWMHINSISTLGKNKWYDAGDERFHPDNIIWDARNANILAIISKASGAIVWKLGPDFNENEQTRKLGWIIGQHHLHMIPAGLPGAGNLLVFDNGGNAGYGVADATAPAGVGNVHRDYSRVLEFDPVTLELIWEYSIRTGGRLGPREYYRFYSPYVSSAQRLPNGNTLITEGTNGRLFEVTAEHEVVWEYINPYFRSDGESAFNLTYRAYRVPYEWIPQLEKPDEQSVRPLDVKEFHVPGSENPIRDQRVTYIDGVDPKQIRSTEQTFVKLG